MKVAEAARIEAALEHGIDIHGRRIFLHGDVEGDSISAAIRGLYLLADASSAPIELFITSYGGELDEAFALHDVTRTIKVPVHTVALGMCQSAAPVLVACGQKGERWASENCEFMLHGVRVATGEGLELPAQMQANIQAIKARAERMDRLLAKYSNKNYAHWKRMSDKITDTVFTADQAVAWGLIDQVWSEKE